MKLLILSKLLSKMYTFAYLYIFCTSYHKYLIIHFSLLLKWEFLEFKVNVLLIFISPCVNHWDTASQLQRLTWPSAFTLCTMGMPLGPYISASLLTCSIGLPVGRGCQTEKGRLEGRKGKYLHGSFLFLFVGYTF